MAAQTSLWVNGTEHFVGSSMPWNTSLNDFLRDVIGLSGTKVMCREGGCGCCTVVVQKCGSNRWFNVNSCLVPVRVCHGWQIITTEGLGSKTKGFNVIQEHLADFNGSQCGFCSPGMVMSMFGMKMGEKAPTKKSAEAALDGNLCRCTGYRAILDACKSLATPDIEVLPPCLLKKQFTNERSDSPKQSGVVGFKAGNAKWYRPQSLEEALAIVEKLQSDRVRIVVGNTSTGVYKNVGQIDDVIDTNTVAELYEISTSRDAVVFGANVSLNSIIETCEKVKDQPGFEYLAQIGRHLSKVANVSVRNIGSWVGNLMTKYFHGDFPSDVFLLLCAADGHVLVETCNSGCEEVSVEDLLHEDVRGKLVTKLTLKPLPDCDFVSYKITPRSQNAHAYVNAAMYFVRNKDTFTVSDSRLYFGGVDCNSKVYVRAALTEAFLKNKSISDQATVTGAFEELGKDLTGCSAYKRDLCQSLLYKAMLKMLDTCVPPDLRSGGQTIERPLMTSQQSFETKESEWPLTKPMPRVTARLQASGEAQYVNDIPTASGMMHAAFVLSSQGNAKMERIDARDALKMEGVLRCILAHDVPGTNTISPPICTPTYIAEPILCDGDVHYAGQPLALIVARTQQIALEAVKRVHVEYSDVKPPVTEISEAIEKQMFFELRTESKTRGDSAAAMASAFKVIEGEVRTQHAAALPHRDAGLCVRAHRRHAQRLPDVSIH